jgi:putative Mg2+ transporter-C (MgtC) family protein
MGVDADDSSFLPRLGEHRRHRGPTASRRVCAVPRRNTAATLWCSGAVGVLCGAGFYLPATVATAFVICVNLLLRPPARAIERHPLSTAELGSRYAITVVCHGDAEAHVRALLLRDLGTALRIQELESTNIEDSNRVEVAASVRADERQDRLLEQIIGRLSLEPVVTSAKWRLVTVDDGFDQSG